MEAQESNIVNRNRTHRAIFRLGFAGRTDTFWTIVLALGFIAALLLEYAAFTFKGNWSYAAARVWLVCGLLTFGYILLRFLHAALWRNLCEKKLLELLLLAGLFFLLCRVIGNVHLYDLDDRAALEVNQGLESILAPDWNYTGTGFQNHSVRQYVINALPSYFMGRSLLSLQLGYALPFLLGICALYTGLRKRAVRFKVSSGLCVLPLYALFVFPFMAEYYLLFEETITPVSYTMMAAGLFLLLTDDAPCVFDSLGLIWTGSMLCRLSEPGMAVLVLLMLLVLVYIIIELRQEGTGREAAFPVSYPQTMTELFVLTEVALVGFFAIAFTQNSSLFSYTMPEGQSWKDLFEAMQTFMADKTFVFWGGMALIVFAYMIASFLLTLTFRDFVLTLWTLALVILGLLTPGILLGGFSQETAALWLLAALPLLMSAIFLNICRRLNDLHGQIKSRIVLACACVCAFAMWQNFNLSHTTSQRYRPASQFLIQDINETLKEANLTVDDPFQIVMISDEMTGNFNEYAGYFYPNAKILYENRSETADMDQSLPTFVYDCHPLAEVWNGYSLQDLEGYVYPDKRRGTEYQLYHGTLVPGQHYTVEFDS
ncbi:MAG: hypothetical protein IKE58_08595 [Blautia sp.]|nr:hypothetical protein [Blautia sp.]